jgi:hypothetical protein
MIPSFTVTFGAKYLTGMAVVPTDKICGRSLSSDHSRYCVINRMINKIPVDMNSIYMKLYVTWPTWPLGHIPQKFEPPCHLYMSWFSYEIGIWLGRMIPHSDFSYYCNIEFIIIFAVFVLYEYCCTCSLLLQFDRAYLYLCRVLFCFVFVLLLTSGLPINS